MSTPARVAQISSCSTAAARNVSAAQMSGDFPDVLDQARQLADGRRLAGAVDADDHDDVRPCAVHGGGLAPRDLADLVLDERRAATRFAASGAHGLDDPLGRGHADVGRDQRFFERFLGLDVNRLAAACRFVGALHDLVEPSRTAVVRVSDSLILSKKPIHQSLPVSSASRSPQ